MKITKTELKKIVQEALLQEMTPAPGGSRFRDPRLFKRPAASFDMAEDVIELLGSKYNIMEEDVPTILFAMAQSLEDG